MIIPILDIVIQVLVTLALLVLSSSALALEAATPDISIQTFAPNRAESPVGIVRYPDISAKDPQLNYAIQLMLKEIRRHRYVAGPEQPSPARTASPNRVKRFIPR